MRRKEFIKNCGLICLGSSIVPTLLQSCSSANYFAKNESLNNKIVVKKSEFIKRQNDKNSERKFVIIKSENLHYPIYLFRFTDNEYSALWMECTHRSCELETQGNYLMCPCHGSEFTNKGIVQNPPAEHNLKTFNVKIDDENIYIQL
ncbi:MAG: Rieske (2Fe-2S) protein [Saprospiraceae bacterium]